ncbi:hypothetical protein ACJRO7_015248 [Eucalyptus globulus]|uniref:Glycine-rich protein n=1 Tax=Eucalyptus globulus TaxID=34317 RepID=A0ABD3L3J2_EUCGL
MAAFKFAPLTLSFAILLLLSRSPRSSAREVTAFTDETVRQRQQQQQRQSSDDVWSPFRARKIGAHVVKRLSGGGGGGGGGGGRSGGGGGGGGRAGGSWGVGGGGSDSGGSRGATPIRRPPGSVVRPIPTGTHGSSATKSRRSKMLGSAVSSSLTLGLLLASSALV